MVNIINVHKSCTDLGIRYFFNLKAKHLPSTFFFVVPESPGTLKLVMISVSSINVTWIPPTVPNGIITKYEVSYHLMSNVIGKCIFSSRLLVVSC